MTVVALLYVLFDVNYFLRTLFTVGWGKLFDKKKKVDETTEIYGKWGSVIYKVFINCKPISES